MTIIKSPDGLVDKDVYMPDLDGQALIDELSLICIHWLRWESIYSLLKSKPYDLAIEGLICKMAWHIHVFRNHPKWNKEADFFTRMYIYILGWDMLPYAKYRRDHPPEGIWGGEWYDFPEHIIECYHEVCDLLVEASLAELMRD